MSLKGKAAQMGVPAGEDVFEQPIQVDAGITASRKDFITEEVIEDTKEHRIVKFNDGTIRKDIK